MNSIRAVLSVLLLARALSPAAPPNDQADRVVVNKAARQLLLYRGETVVRTYKIALGPNAIGPKRRQGDGKTPEGLYKISGRNPKSRFHLSLRISYPGPEDVKRARATGPAPGSDIMIHGLPNGQGHIGAAHRLTDWTDGCVAVTNEEIEEIWKLVPNGTPVVINP